MSADDIAAVSVRRPQIVDLVRAAVRKLSARVHAPADDRARARGWEVAETPGWLGLSGRNYRDPRFDTRVDRQRNAAGKGRAT